jgi:hypothetical protein
MRGELSFYNRPPSGDPTIAFIRQNIQYALVIPFCVLFGTLMRARYGASILLGSIVAAITYGGVVNAYFAFFDWASFRIAQSSNCAATYIDAAIAKHSHAVLVAQGADQLNRQLDAWWKGRGFTIALEDQKYVLELKSSEPIERDKARTDASALSRRMYCDSSSRFRIAHALQIPFVIVIRNPTGEILVREQLTPTDWR